MVSGILSKIISRIQSSQVPARRWFYGTSAVILVLAAALRVFRYFLEPFPVRDGIWYTQMGQLIAENSWSDAIAANPGGLLEFYPPLIFAVISGGQRWGIGAENAGWILIFTTGLLLPVALALIANELFSDWRYTLGALLFGSICPPAVRMSAQLLRETPYWCFCCFALLFGLRAVSGKGWWNWLVFCIFSSLAILTRREGVELLGAFLIFQAFQGWNRKEWFRILTRKCMTIIGVVIFLLLLLLPIQFQLSNSGSRWEPLPWDTVCGILRHL